MPTVYKRVFAHHRNNKTYMLSKEQLGRVGYIVAKDFKENYSHLKRGYIKADSYDGNFTVARYPAEYRDRLDEIIGKFYKIEAQYPDRINTIVKEKRKRIPVNRKVNNKKQVK